MIVILKKDAVCQVFGQLPNKPFILAYCFVLSRCSLLFPSRLVRIIYSMGVKHTARGPKPARCEI